MKLLTDFMERTLNYWGRVRRYYLAEIASERVPQAQADHRELLALLKAGKTGELLDKVAQHNRQALQAYQRLMQSSFLLASVKDLFKIKETIFQALNERKSMRAGGGYNFSTSRRRSSSSTCPV